MPEYFVVGTAFLKPFELLLRLSMTLRLCLGYWYRPSSSRLQRSRRPSSFQMRHLILPGFLPQNMDRTFF